MRRQNELPYGLDMNRRVVITGLGLVTPLGLGVVENWDALIHGRSGIDRITRFDASEFRVQIAGEVKGFDVGDYLDRKKAKAMGLFTHYAIAATQMAVRDAGLEVGKENPERIGVVIGTAMGGMQETEEGYRRFLQRGPRRVSPFAGPRMLLNMAAGEVAILLGAKGPVNCTATACSAGAHAIGDAFKYIQLGYADVMIAGGSEASITPYYVAGFDATGALSHRNDEPQRASRPFDRERDGMVLGEGAGVLVLEEHERARRRGAPIYAELVGFGTTSDAHSPVIPDPEGGARCMLMALSDARLSPDQVDYINAHGTATHYNDWHETLAIKAAFKDHSRRLKISSTKSMTGHLSGAAGAVEAAFCALVIKHGVIPPTINYEYPDPACDLDYTPNEACPWDVKVALSNSMGFGGSNASLIFKKV